MLDLIEQGRVVAHLLYQCLDADDALVHQLQHAVERKLDAGHAWHGFQGTTLFFWQQVGRMIGSHRIDEVALQGFLQGLLVGHTLDGWVAFDFRS